VFLKKKCIKNILHRKNCLLFKKNYRTWYYDNFTVLRRPWHLDSDHIVWIKVIFKWHWLFPTLLCKLCSQYLSGKIKNVVSTSCLNLQNLNLAGCHSRKEKSVLWILSVLTSWSCGSLDHMHTRPHGSFCGVVKTTTLLVKILQTWFGWQHAQCTFWNS
jgi:hypothetical protein